MILETGRKLRKRTTGGFSLIELAILVTIVGLFVSSAAQTYRLYLKKTAYNTTKERMNILEVSLSKFMSVYGRLPCPADPAFGVGHPQGGVENCRPAGAAYPTIACTADESLCRVASAFSQFTPVTSAPTNENQTQVIGTVPSTGDGKDRILRGGIPYTTLGISARDAYDGWGSMYTYAVSELLASFYFLPQGHTGNNCEEVCHVVNGGASFSRSAPAGKRFTDVVFASYGTPVGACPSFSIGACHSGTTLAKIKTTFLGKTSASITANNTNFTEPCTGTAKRLAVILRACAATAVVAYNENNGVIGHKTWIEEEGEDRDIRDPLTGSSNIWPIGIVSHGPDRKGGWNANGKRGIPCTGGRDAVNCTATSNHFIDDAYVSTGPGSLYYDDVGTIRQVMRSGDKWHYSSIAAMRNKEGARVGIGTRSPDPAAVLDVHGSLRVNDRVEAVQFCDPSNTSRCFRSSLIGGLEEGPASVKGMSCSGGRMSGVAYNAPICEDKVDLTEATPVIGTCPSGQYLIGICPNGARMCRTPGGAYPTCP